jgi:hypothetical protein
MIHYFQKFCKIWNFDLKCACSLFLGVSRENFSRKFAYVKNWPAARLAQLMKMSGGWRLTRDRKFAGWRGAARLAETSNSWF